MPATTSTPGATAACYHLARQLIPGGTQLLSKRPEMFAPEQWPAYFARAHGCEVTDLDGREYVDFTHNGVGACLLGYAHPRVVAAVTERVQAGSMCTLNSPDEVWLSQELLAIHPWAQRVRLARGGGEALAIAVRIARAATGRDVVAFCGYHGWCDWYLSANLASDSALNGHLLPGLQPAGVPQGLQGTAYPFRFNQLDELQTIVAREGSRLAAVVMEPLRGVAPAPGFLEGVRELCHRIGARLIFDEVTSGFRFRLGGAHLDFGVQPDVAVFAKALGNGHPIAAILGTAATLDAAQDSFISSTYWTDGVGPVAARTVLAVCQEQDVAGHVRAIGTAFQQLCRELAIEHHVPLFAQGFPALTSLGWNHPDSAALMTLFTVRMLEQGLLVGSGFYPTLAHQPEHLDRFRQAAEAVLPEIALAIQHNDIQQRIGGPVKHSGFARLT